MPFLTEDKKEIIVAFDVGKTTGVAWATCVKNSQRNRIKHGSGDPFEISEIVKKLSKKTEKLTLLFYQDFSFLSAKTTAALVRYKKIISDTVLFFHPNLKIMLFSESMVANQLVGYQIPTGEKKKTLKDFLERANYRFKNYDEVDALALLIWFLTKKGKFFCGQNPLE